MNRKRILALEPYAGGSHADILKGLSRWSRHEFVMMEMPARKWKWRMRGAAIEFADASVRLEGDFDLVFASDMTSVADWRALAPARLASLPTVVYFHENQLTYPLPDESARDYQYGFTNITTCLAADEVWFNSAFHRGEFLAGVTALLARMPDQVPRGVAERIQERSRVVHPGVEPGECREMTRRRPYTVLWNHRWEWDKNPEEFFEALIALAGRGVEFRLAAAGEQFRRRPEVFDRAERKLAEKIISWGYVPSRREYRELLCRSDIVVSTAIHEFFGLSVLEAVVAGAVPLLPRRLSYPEIFSAESNDALFYDEGHLGERLKGLLTDNLPAREEISRLAGKYLWERRICEWDALFADAAQRRASRR